MSEKLTTQQFLSVLKNPRLFAARKKVQQLRKELKGINWKVHSQYTAIGIHKEMRLELFDTGPVGDHFPNSMITSIVENIFPYPEYNTEYLFDNGMLVNQFDVHILI